MDTTTETTKGTTMDCKRINPIDRFAKATSCKNCGRKVISTWSRTRGLHYIHIVEAR